jgi:hypothetical protein
MQEGQHEFELWTTADGMYVLVSVIERYPERDRIILSTDELPTFGDKREAQEALKVAERQKVGTAN